MSTRKRGRKERLKRREQYGVLAQAKLARKEQARQEQGLTRLLPKRERMLLTGAKSASQGIDRDNLLGHTHYAGAYTGKGYHDATKENLDYLIGTSRDTVSDLGKRKPKVKSRFSERVPEPSEQPQIRVGTTPKRLLKIMDKDGKEVWARIPEKPKYAVLGTGAFIKPADGGK